jgi:hypothetical protein
MVKTRVTARARARPDRAGDPLDGLVNLFDLGIVLSVAFLLAALSSLKLGDLFTTEDVQVIRNTKEGAQITVRKDQKVQTINLKGQKVVGRGNRIGSVYKLSDGRIVYVQEGQQPPTGATPSTPGGGSSGGSGSGGSGGSGSGGSGSSTTPRSGGGTTTTPGTGGGGSSGSGGGSGGGSSTPTTPTTPSTPTTPAPNQ